MEKDCSLVSAPIATSGPLRDHINIFSKIYSHTQCRRWVLTSLGGKNIINIRKGHLCSIFSIDKDLLETR